MAFTVSPGVVTREIDLTTIVPETGTTAGAFAGAFRWGPIDKIVNIDAIKNEKGINFVTTFDMVRNEYTR